MSSMRSILKITPLTIFIAISFNTVVLAGDFEKDVTVLLKQEPQRAGNLHHCYEEPDHIYDTPAPRGYKPFYVDPRKVDDTSPSISHITTDMEAAI